MKVHRNAAWIREITDVVAVAKSRHRLRNVGSILNAMYRGQLTSATFSLLDPLPFVAEFALWISSGLKRQIRAKKFLQLDPVGSKPE